ncbi:hypothetical protein [Chitinimonas naiadis]
MQRVHQAVWVPVQVPASFSQVDILRTIAVCQGSLKLRMREDDDGRLWVEALGNANEHAAELEARIQQCLADQALRRAITEQSEDQITQIVDAVLIKAGAR